MQSGHTWGELAGIKLIETGAGNRAWPGGWIRWLVLIKCRTTLCTAEVSEEKGARQH